MHGSTSLGQEGKCLFCERTVEIGVSYSEEPSNLANVCDSNCAFFPYN